METGLTTTNQELTVLQEPESVLDTAIKASKSLTRVVSQKKKPVMMNGEQYLEYEDWQTLGQFYGVTAITGDAIPVEIDGVKGAKATAKLIKIATGEIIGGAEAYCLRDEPNWTNKPWFQLASMAQTRAGAKALRNRLAWIAVLGGYKPTPAEEMTVIDTHKAEPINTTEHYCKTHNTKFFKSAKMKSFAHPIEGTNQWCYEHTEETVPTETKPAPTSKSKPSQQEPVDMTEVYRSNETA